MHFNSSPPFSAVYRPLPLTFLCVLLPHGPFYKRSFLQTLPLIFLSTIIVSLCCRLCRSRATVFDVFFSRLKSFTTHSNEFAFFSHDNRTHTIMSRARSNEIHFTDFFFFVHQSFPLGRLIYLNPDNCLENCLRVGGRLVLLPSA